MSEGATPEVSAPDVTTMPMRTSKLPRDASVGPATVAVPDTVTVEPSDVHKKSVSTTLPVASFANASANAFFFGHTSAIASLRGCGVLSRARAFLSMASGEESELVKPSHQAVASFLFVACVV